MVTLGSLIVPAACFFASAFVISRLVLRHRSNRNTSEAPSRGTASTHDHPSERTASTASSSFSLASRCNSASFCR